MNWLLLSLGAYLCIAVANVMDKVLLSRFLKQAVLYAFYVGVLQFAAIILIPFGVGLLPLAVSGWALVGGAAFVAAIFAMNAGFVRGEVTRVTTIIGGSLPVFTFLFSRVFLHETLTLPQYIALAFLICGIIALIPDLTGKRLAREDTNISTMWAIGAGALYAIAFGASKIVYLAVPFVTGFFWMRMAAVVTGIALLLLPRWRKTILADIRQPKKEQARSKSLLLVNQVIGAIGFILLNLAFSIGSVTLINALQGVQYVLIFLITLFVGRYVVELREKYTAPIVAQKTFSLLLIGAGIIFLSF